MLPVGGTRLSDVGKEWLRSQADCKSAIVGSTPTGASASETPAMCRQQRLSQGFFVALGSKDEQRQLPDRLGRFRSTRTLESVRIARMTTAEAIYERALALPESLRREALHYLEYLLQRQDAAGQPAADDEAAWTRLSAEQLAAHYGPDDSVYDSP